MSEKPQRQTNRFVHKKGRPNHWLYHQRWTDPDAVQLLKTWEFYEIIKLET